MKKKKGSGRTKGATSFVYVKLGDLNARLKETQEVLVNRRFAEMLKLPRRKVTVSTEMVKDLTVPEPEITKIDLG